MPDDRALFEAACAARLRAHAPYSRFSVGAAIRTQSGAVHSGCNVENASFPEGWCAETSAIAAMVGEAEIEADKRIEAVWVVADTLEGRLVTPCGGCRQRLAEFGTAETEVHVSDPAGSESQTYRLSELLPAGFILGDRP